MVGEVVSSGGGGGEPLQPLVSSGMRAEGIAGRMKEYCPSS